MEQDEEEERGADEDVLMPELYKGWDANDFSRARDILQSADYDWEPAPELDRFRPEVFAPRNPADPTLANDKAEWEDYDDEDYEEFGLRQPDEEQKARYWRELH